MLSFLKNQNEEQSLRGGLTEKSQSFIKTSDSQVRYKFYKRFIEQGRLISCKIINVSTTPSTTFHRSYATYQIQLLTQDTHYSISRRYSQFRKIWNTVEKYIKNIEQFPPKTIWRSSIQEEVTTHRVQSLNKFLKQIVAESTQQEAKIIFFEFVKLFEAYQEREISLDFLDQSTVYDGDLLVLQIMKLNQHPRNIIAILQEISKIIFQKRIKVNSELIKQTFYGFQHRKGLIELIFSTNNEMIAVQGLKLLNDLLDPEKHKDYQFYLKIFLMGSYKILRLAHPQLLQNSHLKRLYFQIIQLYIDKKQNIAAKNIFPNNQSILVDFQQWFESRKIQNDPLYCKKTKSPLRISKSEKSLANSVFDLKQSQLDFRQPLQNKSQNCQINQLFKLCVKSCQPIKALKSIFLRAGNHQDPMIESMHSEKIVKISLALKNSYKQNLSIFKKGFSYLNESDDIHSKVQCSQFIHKKYIKLGEKTEKKIKFKQFTFDLKQKNTNQIIVQQITIARKPIHTIIGDFCFVLIGQLTKLQQIKSQISQQKYPFQHVQSIKTTENQQKQKKTLKIDQSGCVVQYIFGFCHKNVKQYFEQQVITGRLAQRIKNNYYSFEQNDRENIN